MKKPLVVQALMLALIILISPSCNQKGNQSAAQTKPNDDTTTKKFVSETPGPPPAHTYTLNGYSGEQADKMVHYFLSNKGSCDKNNFTCIFFKKTEIATMVQAAIQNFPNLDGVRLYFARTSDNGPYTIIAVATIDNGLDPSDSNHRRHIHNDVFFTVNPFSAPVGLLPVDASKPTTGARLYNASTPCTADGCPAAIQAQHNYLSCGRAYTMVNTLRSSDEINATSEWFDIGAIESLLQMGIPDGGGLRIYFARHQQAVSPDTVNRHGFVILITKPGSGGTQVDDFACITIITHYPYFMMPQDHGGGTDNGEECPTNCSGVTWP